MNSDEQKVIKRIKRSKIDADFVSPNFVALVAYNNNIKLTSEQVVKISNEYK